MTPITLAAFIELLATTVATTGLVASPHLLAAQTIAGPGIERQFALDIQTQASPEERRNVILPVRHAVTITYWWRYPTKGADVTVWSSMLAIEQDILTAVHERRAEWRSTYTGTRRTLNPSAELIRVDVAFTLLARHDVTPSE